MIPLGVLASARVAASGGGSLEFVGSGQSIWTGSSATYTMSGVAFGAAASDRVIIAAITTRVTAGRSLTGVTIGGVPATLDIVTTTWPSAIIARAAVPSGTSGDVVVTYNAAEGGPVYVAAYAAYGTVTVSGTARHYSGSNTTSSASLSHAAGACLVAAVSSSSSSNDITFTWGGGLTEDFSRNRSNNGSSGLSASAGSMTHANGLPAGPTTISAVSTGASYQGLAAAAYLIT